MVPSLLRALRLFVAVSLFLGGIALLAGARILQEWTTISTWGIALVTLWVAGLAALALSTGFAAIVLTYIASNLLYSWRLKHVPILDVFIVAAGFVLLGVIYTYGFEREASRSLSAAVGSASGMLPYQARHE